jgi:hypothetical protein
VDAEGPPLEALTRRLAECPADFLAEPRVGANGQVRVAAVVADLLRDLGGPLLTSAQAELFQPRSAQPAGGQRNWLAPVLVTAWLFDDPWFRQGLCFGARAADFLTNGLNELANLNPAGKFVSDPDRREELVRLGLSRLGLRPAGETPAQAADRLATISTTERQRVSEAARAAVERARAIREAMAKKAAEEAAAQSSRE